MDTKPASGGLITSSNTLSIQFHDWLNRHGELVDPATGTPLYTIEHRWVNPTFSLHGTNQSHSPLVTARRIWYSPKAILSIAGRDIELAPQWKWGGAGGDVTYASPSYGERRLRWDPQNQFRRVRLVCTDEEARVVARVGLGTSGWSWGRLSGEVEFGEEMVRIEPQRDEVVAVGLYLAYMMIMRKKKAAGAGAGSGMGGTGGVLV